MRLILCLDERGGLSFYGRRLSRDVAVCRRILELSRGAELWMSPGSQPLFISLEGNVFACEDYLDRAGEGAFCFAETQLPDMSRVQTLYVFRWGRHYPSDVRFFPEEFGFSIISEEQFSGKSHDKITLEVYAK